MNTSDKVDKIVVSKQCGLSPDKDSDESKTFTIRLTIEDVTLLDMAHAILRTEVIRWQNAKRSQFAKLENNSTIDLKFKAPIAQVDPEAAMIAKLKSMSAKDRKAELDRLAKLIDSE